MRLPSKAALVVTAGLAFNAMPANAEAPQAQSSGDTETATLNQQAQQAIMKLGSKVLHLRITARHNRHVQDVETKTVAPGIREVEIDYTARRPNHHTGLGTYTVTAAFATKGKKLSVKNILDISVSQNAGKDGPYALLDLRKTEDGGYQFTGNYEYPKKHYSQDIAADTQPDADEYKLTGPNLRDASKQIAYLMKLAPSGRAITEQLEPPFIGEPLPPSNRPTPTPTPTSTS